MKLKVVIHEAEEGGYCGQKCQPFRDAPPKEKLLRSYCKIFLKQSKGVYRKTLNNGLRTC
jgi:hypothetical protein